MNSSYELPSMHQVLGEPPFAKVKMGWSEEGLAWDFDIRAHPLLALASDRLHSDCIELFIDTKNLKISSPTLFCHHFVFYLKPCSDAPIAQEITRFKGEVTRQLCDPQNLHLELKKNEKGVVARIFIPKDCLYGYDPHQTKKLGFTYQINRSQSSPQHFAVSSHNYSVEGQPSLWATIELVDAKNSLV